MSSHRLSNHWMLLSLFGVLLSCALVLMPVRAQPADPGFGFDIPKHEQAVALIFGAGFDPHLPGYGMAAMLAAGQEAPFRLWEIDPLALYPRFKQAQGAAQAFLNGAGGQGSGSIPAGLGVLLVLKLGDERDYWTVRDTTLVEKIEPALLEQVQDSKGIGGWQDGNTDVEHQAYFAMMVAAHRTPQATLEKFANRQITYAHLMTEPKRYRGEMVELTGRLKRIRRFDPPAMAKENGIPHLYEGWVFFEPLGANPFCIVFSELPPDLRVAEQLDVPVKFVGYSYKRYRYTPAEQTASKPNLKREAPLLIGRTVTPIAALPQRPVEEPVETWAKGLGPLFVSVILGVVIVMFVTLLWFRRADAAVKKRIHSAAHKDFVLPASESNESNESNQPT